MTEGLHIPILRHGRRYESLDKETIVHGGTGAALAEVSMANSGLIEWDSGLTRLSAGTLRALSTRDVLEACARAADMFLEDDLPLEPDGPEQSASDFVESLSATTGLPQVICRGHMQRLHDAMSNLEQTLYGLTRGLGPDELDAGLAHVDGMSMRHVHRSTCLAAVLPSNAPGVNALWLPALGFRTPVALRPGHADPWTPLRLIAALMRAGLPGEAFSFYPSGHAGGHALVRSRTSAMVFGGPETVAVYGDRSSVELHGSGQSKIIFGPDTSGDWAKYLEVIDRSVLHNGGRSCINASTIVVPEGAKELAEVLAQRWADIAPLALDHDDAKLAGFVDPAVAQQLNQSLDAALQEPGATDVSRAVRGSDRLVQAHGLSFILPTVLHCSQMNHPLAQVERPFPMVAIVEMPIDQIADWLSYSLVVTLLSEDAEFVTTMATCERIGNLHLGPIPTVHKDWGQPHEGNLFELLMRRSALAGGL